MIFVYLQEYLYSPDQIETPQPTPKATPIASPIRVVSPPVTPELSPPPSPRQEVLRVERAPEPMRLPPQPEPESEISESLDLSEELRILRRTFDIDYNHMPSTCISNKWKEKIKNLCVLVQK